MIKYWTIQEFKKALAWRDERRLKGLRMLRIHAERGTIEEPIGKWKGKDVNDSMDKEELLEIIKSL